MAKFLKFKINKKKYWINWNNFSSKSRCMCTCPYVTWRKKKSLFKSILGLVCELHTRNKISNVLSLLTCQLMTQLKLPSESLCRSVFDSITSGGTLWSADPKITWFEKKKKKKIHNNLKFYIYQSLKENLTTLKISFMLIKLNFCS